MKELLFCSIFSINCKSFRSIYRINCTVSINVTGFM